jgi:hypothetical protein
MCTENACGAGEKEAGGKLCHSRVIVLKINASKDESVHN